MNKRALASGLLIVALLILHGCASQRTAVRDSGHPPDAVPKVEPLSRYGNMESYEVFGQRYYPKTTSRNYAERGIASWYGRKFHGRKTSSLEPYNMYAMTAAHKTLPLPSYVQVINLENGRSVVVRVNDRGPFHDNRIIDLSYAAAKKLGFDQAGTADVKVRSVDPRDHGRKVPLLDPKRVMAQLGSTPPPPRTSNHLPAGNYLLQVGAFDHRLNAEDLRSRLLAQVNAPVNIRFDVSLAPSALYRVHVGPFGSRDQAEATSRQLQTLGVPQSLVVSP